MGAKYSPSSTLDEEPMIHKGIEYSVAATVEPDVWQWRFQIGESVRTGRTKTRLGALAARRVQMKIDAILRTSGDSFASRSENRAGYP